MQEALDYCHSKGLDFYAVNSNYPEEQPDHHEPRKLVADLWIDDRNLGGIPDWGVIYTMVHTGKCWEPVPQDAILPPEPPKKGFFSRLFN